MQRVQRGDTIIIGVDYYAELGVSNFFFPEKFHALYGQWLIDGEVLFFQVMRQEDRVVFKQLPNKKGRYWGHFMSEEFEVAYSRQDK